MTLEHLVLTGTDIMDRLIHRAAASTLPCPLYPIAADLRATNHCTGVGLACHNGAFVVRQVGNKEPSVNVQFGRTPELTMIASGLGREAALRHVMGLFDSFLGRLTPRKTATWMPADNIISVVHSMRQASTSVQAVDQYGWGEWRIGAPTGEMFLKVVGNAAVEAECFPHSYVHVCRLISQLAAALPGGTGIQEERQHE